MKVGLQKDTRMPSFPGQGVLHEIVKKETINSEWHGLMTTDDELAKSQWIAYWNQLGEIFISFTELTIPGLYGVQVWECIYLYMKFF